MQYPRPAGKLENLKRLPQFPLAAARARGETDASTNVQDFVANKTEDELTEIISQAENKTREKLTLPEIEKRRAINRLFEAADYHGDGRVDFWELWRAFSMVSTSYFRSMTLLQDLMNRAIDRSQSGHVAMNKHYLTKLEFEKVMADHVTVTVGPEAAPPLPNGQEDNKYILKYVVVSG